MIRLAVTGARGFIGSQVTRRAEEFGHEVLALDRESVDLMDITALTESLVGFDTLIHLAWYTDPSDYLSNLDGNLYSLQTSISVTRACLAAGIRRVVLGGSCIEGSEEAGSSPYLWAKTAQHRLGDQIREDGLSVVCAHIFHLFGPGENPRRAIPSVISGLLRSHVVPVTKGEQLRDYLHVRDVASALCAVAVSDVSGTIDISSGSSVTLKEVLELIRDRIDRGKLEFGALRYSPRELFRTVGDASGLRLLGWEPSLTLEEGILDTIDWWAKRIGAA